MFSWPSMLRIGMTCFCSLKCRSTASSTRVPFVNKVKTMSGKFLVTSNMSGRVNGSPPTIKTMETPSSLACRRTPVRLAVSISRFWFPGYEPRVAARAVQITFIGDAGIITGGTWSPCSSFFCLTAAAFFCAIAALTKKAAMAGSFRETPSASRKMPLMSSLTMRLRSLLFSICYSLQAIEMYIDSLCT